MKAATREWVDRAEADYAAALLLRPSRKKHSRDILCFHLQQCTGERTRPFASSSFDFFHDVLKDTVGSHALRLSL